MIISLYAGPEVQNQAAEVLMGGQFYIPVLWCCRNSWINYSGYTGSPRIKRISTFPVAIPVLLVLIGGLVFQVRND